MNEDTIGNPLTFDTTSYWLMTDQQKDDAKRLSDVIQQPISVHFWGSDYTIKPVFVKGFIGDGKQLLGLTPLNTRPNYYVLRVDSSWSLDNHSDGETVGDHIDEIYDLIEEECGSSDDPAQEEDRGWPMLNTNCGSSWWKFPRAAHNSVSR